MKNANEKTTRVPSVSADMAGDGALRLTFKTGNVLTLAHSQLSGDICIKAMWHGLKQKLVDAAAIGRNPDTGRSATEADKYQAVKEVYDRLLTGEWNKNREGGSPVGGLLLRALCIVYPNRTVEALKAFIEKKTPKERAAMRETTRIAKIIVELKERDAKESPPVDEDALFAGLDYEPAE